MFFDSKFRIAAGVVVGLIVISLIWSVFSKSGSSATDFFTVSTRTVTQRVSVTGKVAPFEKADLGFESAGTLASKNYKVGDRVKVGDVIASLDTSGAYASLSGAQANYASEAAKLEDLAKGLRPEEITVEETKVQNAQTAYADAQQSMNNAIRDAYTKTTSAVLNYTDAFYQNAQTAAPLIIIHTESTAVRDRANDGRVLLTDMFRNWKNKIDANVSLPDLVAETKKNLDTAKSFLGLMTSIVSTISTGNSGASQSVIDGYNLTLSSANTNLNSALVGVTSADASLRSASSSLALA
ncbi:biotin/lipoyl-binding protein, partial [bacterium]|nr:biotin/lipoyl-binding protein [bacterium]